MGLIASAHKEDDIPLRIFVIILKVILDILGFCLSRKSTISDGFFFTSVALSVVPKMPHKFRVKRFKIFFGGKGWQENMFRVSQVRDR